MQRRSGQRQPLRHGRHRSRPEPPQHPIPPQPEQTFPRRPWAARRWRCSPRGQHRVRLRRPDQQHQYRRDRHAQHECLLRRLAPRVARLPLPARRFPIAKQRFNRVPSAIGVRDRRNRRQIADQQQRFLCRCRPRRDHRYRPPARFFEGPPAPHHPLAATHQRADWDFGMATEQQAGVALDAHNPVPAVGCDLIGKHRTAKGPIGDDDRGGGGDDLADAIEQRSGIGPEGGGAPGIAGMEHPREWDGASVIPEGGGEQGPMVGVGGFIDDDGHGVGGHEVQGGGEDGVLEGPRELGIPIGAAQSPFMTGGMGSGGQSKGTAPGHDPGGDGLHEQDTDEPIGEATDRPGRQGGHGGGQDGVDPVGKGWYTRHTTSVLVSVWFRHHRVYQPEVVL